MRSIGETETMWSGCRPLLLLAMTAFAVQGAEETEWKIETQGQWEVRSSSPRGLLTMRHPWHASETGDFALAWTERRIPDHWTGHVYLHFYCTDDYQAGEPSSPPKKGPAKGFVGHRLKQVLINNIVVWSHDVADPAPSGTIPYHTVAIDVKPGEEFRLSLLLFDKAASTQVLDTDFYVDEKGAKERPQGASEPFRFMTNVYWGDIKLTQSETPPPPARRPLEGKVQALHSEVWPLPPFGDGWEKSTARLAIAGAETLSKNGFPLQFGLPIPAGKAAEASEVRLQNFKKLPLACQKTVLSRWPDDSVRWVLVDMPVTPYLKAVDLAFRADTATVRTKNTVRALDRGFAVDTGMISAEAVPGDLLQKVCLSKKTIFDRVCLSLGVDGEVIPGSTAEALVTDEGPFRTALAAEGRFEGARRRAASFLVYSTFFAGMPYLKMDVRLYNDTAEELRLSALELEYVFQKPPEKYAISSVADEGDFVLQQAAGGMELAGGKPISAETPPYVAWEGGALAVHRFRERYPRTIRAEEGRLIVDLAAAGDTPVSIPPGEALSHEVWVALGDIEPSSFAAAVERPPIFANPAYYCATGVLGPARPRTDIPKIEEAFAEKYAGKCWGDLEQQYGLRHFPDAPYFGGLPAWCNNYPERMLGLWSEWFMTGDRIWYDRAVDVSRHIIDVAVIHSPVPEGDWEGALHGPGPDHHAPPWNPMLRTAGLELYHKLTGDPEAREAFLGVADYCVRTRAGIGSPSARDQAAPFDAICTAYAETGDPVYLDDGAARMESTLRFVDRRRGAWPESSIGDVYRGNTPWQDALLARPLYHWYRMTGDVEAAQLLVGLAESIVCENTAWETPGAVAPYAYGPGSGPSADYDLLILPLIFAAHELSGGPHLLQAATQQYRRWCASPAVPSVFSAYWQTPWLAWYLDKYSVPAKPEEKDAKE